jgi:hypothetical protein
MNTIQQERLMATANAELHVKFQKSKIANAQASFSNPKSQNLFQTKP